MHFVTLTNLDGVKRRPVKAVPFLVRSHALKALTRYRAVTTAGDIGALTVWRDDSGQLRGERYRNMGTRDAQIFRSKRAMAVWLKDAMVKIGLS